MVTSNLPFDEWTTIFGSERLTGALLDRLTHHVHILESRVAGGRGGLGPDSQHPVSRPRSSNRTCRFPASGSPIDFTAKLSVSIHSRRVPFAARRFLQT
jgi:IstB-like ATP binding protein